MTKDEIMDLTEKWLKSVPVIRKRIRLIDVALKKDTYDMDTIEKLKQERKKLHRRLSKIIKAINTLEDENQRIICYRYFEQLNYSEIGVRAGHKGETVSRRIKKMLLVVGRVMFGFEDEFWNEIEVN